MGWSAPYAKKTVEHHLAEVPSGKGIQMTITVTARDNGITEVCGTPVGGDAISGELGAAEAVTALLVEFFKLTAARARVDGPAGARPLRTSLDSRAGL